MGDMSVSIDTKQNTIRWSRPSPDTFISYTDPAHVNAFLIPFRIDDPDKLNIRFPIDINSIYIDFNGRPATTSVATVSKITVSLNNISDIFGQKVFQATCQPGGCVPLFLEQVALSRTMRISSVYDQILILVDTSFDLSTFSIESIFFHFFDAQPPLLPLPPLDIIPLNPQPRRRRPRPIDERPVKQQKQETQPPPQPQSQPQSSSRSRSRPRPVNFVGSILFWIFIVIIILASFLLIALFARQSKPTPIQTPPRS